MTVTQSNWWTNVQTTDYMGIINFRCFFRACSFCINRVLFFIVFLFLCISKYEVYFLKIQWKCSAFGHLMQSKQSKFKADENFARFPSFQFCLMGQIKNLETSEIFFFLLNLILKLHFSCFKSFFWFLDFEFLILPKL